MTDHHDHDHDHDRELDARLRAAFAPPSSTQLASIARAAAHAPRRTLPLAWLLAAAAAVLTIVFMIARPARGPEGHDGAQLGALWAAAFADAETNGFASGSCCDGGQDLAGVCQQRFAVRLRFGGSDDVTVHGCYCGLPTGGCVAALCHTGNDPVGVFVVPREQDPGPHLPASSGLHLARRELGPLVLYAVSRSPRPASLAPFELAP